MLATLCAAIFSGVEGAAHVGHECAQSVHMPQIMARQAAVLQIGNDNVELEELREMKADVERRERAQAAVLERQAKRLEELDSLYKVGTLHFQLHRGRGSGCLY